MLKKSGILVLLLLLLSNVFAQECDTILYSSPKFHKLIGGSKMKNILPGQTVCLKAGKYFQIEIQNLQGTEEKPIKIIPVDGEVIIDTNSHFGIKISHSSHIILSGMTDSLQYGIRVLQNNGTGISIDELSSDIEICGCEVGNVTLTGIVAKTDPDCSLTAVRDSFLMKNILIHHNYIHHTGYEGLYIGNTFFTGVHIQCNGKDTLVLPHLNENIKIYDNYISHTGYDGIQVSSTTKGCQIHDNQIYFDSQKKQWGQMSGIIIGDGTKAECYNNIIAYGAGIGIEVHGQASRIYNNLIVEAGRTYVPNQQGAFSKPAIFVGYNLYNPTNQAYKIYQNTIYRPKSEGIRFVNQNSAKNEIINNIIVDPGIWKHFDSIGIPTNNAFINIGSNITFEVQNNYTTRDTSELRFVDSQHFNFMLQPSSPAIDKGKNLLAEGIHFDLNYSQRPWGKEFDIGAYEYFPTQGSLEMEVHPFIKNIFFDTNSKNFRVLLKSSLKGKVKIVIYNLQGKKLYSFVKENSAEDSFSFSVPHLSEGIYLINLIGDGFFYSQLILIAYR